MNRFRVVCANHILHCQRGPFLYEIRIFLLIVIIIAIINQYFLHFTIFCLVFDVDVVEYQHHFVCASVNKILRCFARDNISFGSSSLLCHLVSPYLLHTNFVGSAHGFVFALRCSFHALFPI